MGAVAAPDTGEMNDARGMAVLIVAAARMRARGAAQPVD